MSAAVLSDFGSTVVKVTVVDLEGARVLGHGEAPTFLGGDVMVGFDAAFDEAVSGVASLPDVTVRLSASSAGGGLRMAAVGLVEEMTGAAAHRAALNAGGRVELLLHGQLAEEDCARLDTVDPEIVLFGGGTDGGQSAQVMENARVLAAGSWSGHVIVACNREVADAVVSIFRTTGRTVSVVDNLMPRVGAIAIDAARVEIMSTFLTHVIRGKNLSARPGFLDTITTATPEAVLSATRLLTRGTSMTPGLGDVVVVDVGGATTDVHSVTSTVPSTRCRRGPLLPMSEDTRTVHGDLGMRAGAVGVVDVDRAWLMARSGRTNAEWELEAQRRAADPTWLADSPADVFTEELLGSSCVSQALMRHCGRQSWVYARGESSPTLTVMGPDLRDVAVVVGTGGVIVHSKDPTRVLDPALERAANACMSPQDKRVVIDRDYVLAAGGLLRQLDDDLAFQLLMHALDLDSVRPAIAD
jgi:uncharacterized protein (TIGR01319 family)